MNKTTNHSRGRKWASLGDSITAGEKWQPYVVSEFGFIHTNCGIGGTRLAGTDSNAFWQDSRLDVVKAANPDLVTILGGANDLTQDIRIGTDAEFEKPLESKEKTTFKGAYSYIVEHLLTWKPTLRIFILTTTWGHNDGADLDPPSGIRYTDYANASAEVAKYYGLPCVDLHGEAGFNKITKSIYFTDNIHPNEEGGKRIAELVIAKMRITMVKPVKGSS